MQAGGENDRQQHIDGEDQRIRRGFVEQGQTGPIAFLSILLFVGANLVIGWIALRTVRLAVAGKLLPTRAPP